MNLTDPELQSLYRAFFKAENEATGNVKQLYDATVRALEELLIRRSKESGNAQTNSH